MTAALYRTADYTELLFNNILRQQHTNVHADTNASERWESGHSWGGGAGLNHPSRVRRLVGTGSVSLDGALNADLCRARPGCSSFSSPPANALTLSDFQANGETSTCWRRAPPAETERPTRSWFCSADTRGALWSVLWRRFDLDSSQSCCPLHRAGRHVFILS